jgi:hypothetical protein
VIYVRSRHSSASVVTFRFLEHGAILFNATSRNEANLETYGRSFS